MSQLGAIIERAQERSGQSQEEFARTCGVSQRTLQRYIAGDTKPSGSCLKKISEMTGIPLPHLRSLADGLSEVGRHVAYEQLGEGGEVRLRVSVVVEAGEVKREVGRVQAA